MKTLFTLGDSFMTTDYPDDGIVNFTELYARKKGFNHVSLARPGATNFAIRLQIDRAIEQKPNYIVIGLTSTDRFDVTVKANTNQITLNNIDYSNYRAVSEQYIDSQQTTIVSDTFNNLIEGQRIGAHKQQALKTYIADLHDPSIQAQKDYYIIADGLRALQQHNIPFLLIPKWMNQFDWSWVDRVWPDNVPSPYDMPYGPAGWYDLPRYTGTHNPAHAHREFCQTLESITLDWD